MLYLISIMQMNAKAAKPSTKLLASKLKSNVNSANNPSTKIHSQTTLSSNSLLHKQKRQQVNTFYSQYQIEQSLQLLQQICNVSTNPKHTKSYIKEKTAGQGEDIVKMQEGKKMKNQKGNLASSKARKGIQAKKNTNAKEENTKVFRLNREQQSRYIDQKQTYNNIFNVTNITIQPSTNANEKPFTNSQLVDKLTEVLNQNKDLKNKIEQFKSLNQQSKKLLRDQIISFNLEGEETKKSKEAFACLQQLNQTLSFEKGLLTQEKLQLLQQMTALQAKIQALTFGKAELQQQKSLLIQKLSQIQSNYKILSQRYEQELMNSDQKQNQIKSLRSMQTEGINLASQPNLNASSAQLDQITDLSINSHLKEESINVSKALILQHPNQDLDYMLNSKSLEHKYKSLVNELKSKIIDIQKLNFQLQYENLRHSQSNLSCHYQISIDTDKRTLELLKENSGLKINEYELKQEMKQLREQKVILQFKAKQILFEKELQIEKLNVLKLQYLQRQQSDIQFLRRQNEQLRKELAQAKQIIREAEKKKGQQVPMGCKLLPGVRKIKIFK